MAKAVLPALVPFLNRHHRQIYVIMHDNVLGYRTNATEAGLQHKENLFLRPSKSPDMIPIGNISAQLQRLIDTGPKTLQNAKLWRTIREEWRTIKMRDILVGYKL